MNLDKSSRCTNDGACMKRFLVFLICLFGFQAHAAEQLTIAVSGAPHSEILELVRPILAHNGVNLKIKVFHDIAQLNTLVQEKRLDGNFYQHKLFLKEFNKINGTNLVEVTGVHIELMGVYSLKVKSLKDLREGAVVAIPSDPANRSRALRLLNRAGLIELDNPSNPLATTMSIRRNPYGVKIHELEGSVIPRLLPKIDLAVMTTNYVIDSGVNAGPPIIKEEKSDDYINILVVHRDNSNKLAIRKLVWALQSDSVRNFIRKQYKDMIIPAF